MKKKEPVVDMDSILNAQKEHWEHVFSKEHDKFGIPPSGPARRAAEIFMQEGAKRIIELGAGQGRDTIFFAQMGFHVYGLDYCESGVRAIEEKARGMGLSQRIELVCHDLREPLPFSEGVFDACYSHMLYCMAFKMEELIHLSKEIRRVLRHGGINLYTVRNTRDPDYATGVHRGEDMYEIDGYVIHFFDRKKIELLSDGYQIVSIDEFEEGVLPKRLFQVFLRKI